jgi:putative Mn2+ efflux pump MntP
MFLTQFIMAGAGIWIGNKFGSSEVRTNMLISLSILLLIGLKEVFTGIRSRTEEKDNDVSENKATFFAALAEGITASAIGLSIGLLSLQPYLHWFFIGAFILTGIITSLLLASRVDTTSAKFRLEPVGGLLFLAAAIKLAINLAGF